MCPLPLLHEQSRYNNKSTLYTYTLITIKIDIPAYVIFKAKEDGHKNLPCSSSQIILKICIVCFEQSFQ